jgi:hypothetical protein
MAVIEPPLSGDFLVGVRAGLARVDRHGLDAPREARDQLMADPPDRQADAPEALVAAQRLMRREDVSGRFVELFAEMVTVAVSARHTYGDEALTASDVEAYLSHSYSIFNSFRHA